MNDIKDGGPAFPTLEVIATDGDGPITHAFLGMTLRDYFAAKAMQAAITAAASWGPCLFRDFDVDAVSEFANRQADAMLKARET